MKPKSRFKGKTVFIKTFSDEFAFRVTVLSVFSDLGIKFYKLKSDDGTIFNVPVDSVNYISEVKKAKVLPFKRKLKLLK